MTPVGRRAGIGALSIDTRLGRAVRLLAVAALGSMVMGMTSGGIYVAISVDRYATPLNLGYAPVRDAYLMAWAFCASGLGVVALLCLWRRSRGRLTWTYGGAVGLAFLAMMAIWIVPAFAMGFSTPGPGSTWLGNLGMGLGMWLLTSAYAMFFNAVNLLLVVPAVIDAWYAVLNRGTPAQVPAGTTRRRRCWLYGLTALAIVFLCCTGP